MYEKGTKNLVVAAHRLNATSSRSHSIFSVNIECNNSEGMRVFSSTLTLVDLAGSEKIATLSNTVKLQEESIDINKSLFYLRKVISTLAEGRPSTHVPYRNSRLTCLLKSALGGRSSCLMVV